jgi:hypothetical protein
LQLQIEDHGQNAIVVFALPKCGDFRPFADHLTVMTAQRPALDGDFGVANRDDAEQQGAAYTADRGPSGMKVKNTSTPL